jgi:DNA-binding transcriptional ArsR family regulator
MQPLNPTLWRTCKMLAGRTRIHLLRELNAHPGACVTDLGERVGIAEPAASQELRRIQSRGLLQAERQGVRLIYRMAADPQVSSAAPLLKALRTSLDEYPRDQDEQMCRLAAGLAHERRIRMFRTLLEGSRRRLELPLALHIPPHPFQSHLSTLLKSGFILLHNGHLSAVIPDHPLAKALAKLIQQGLVR